MGIGATLLNALKSAATWQLPGSPINELFGYQPPAATPPSLPSGTSGSTLPVITNALGGLQGKTDQINALATQLGQPALPPGGAGGGGISGGLPSFNMAVSPQDFLTTNQGMDPQQYANLVAGMQFDPQIAAVQRNIGTSQTQADRAIQAIQEQLNLGVGTQERYGQIGDVKLQDVYGALQRELEGGQQKLQGIYSGGVQGVQDIYGGATRDVAGAGANLINQLQASAGKLGLEAAFPGVAEQAAQNVASSLGRFGAAGAGGAQNLGNVGADIQGLGQLGISQSRQELAQQRSDLVTGAQSAIAQLQLGAAKETRGVREKLSDTVSELEAQLTDLGSARGSAVRVAFEDAMQAKNERERQGKLDALNAQVAQAGLELDRARLGLEQQKAAQGADPLEALLKQAQIENIYSQIGQREQQPEEFNKYIAQYGPRLQSSVYAVLGQAMDRSEATNLAVSAAAQNRLDPSVVLKAIDLYYGKRS